MSKSRLVSGKVKKSSGSELDLDRKLFLNLANAEPDLGNPEIDGSILVADVDGTRYWSPSIRADVTGNIFLGSINSADGSTAIRLTNSTIIEGDLTIDSVGNIPTLITSDIRSLDSSSIVIANSIIAQSNLEVQNDLTVNGNFTVLGSTTTINSTTLTVEDKNIELAKNSDSAEASDGAGITVNGPTTPAQIFYNADTDTWNFNKTIVGTVEGATSIQDIDDRINLFFDNDINTTDSSSIVFVPSVEVRSDLTVDNDLRVSNIVYASKFIGDGSQLTGIDSLTFNDVDDRISLFFDNDINTSDSSSIVFVPSVEVRSDLTVENDLRVSNIVYADKFIGDGSQLTGIVTSGGGSGSQFYSTENPPIGAVQGDFWFDTTRAVLAVYIDDGDSLQWVEVSASGYEGPQGPIGYTGSAGIGAEAFTDLSDTPTSYSGQAGKIVLVNATEDRLEFGDAPTSATPEIANLYQSGTLVVIEGTARWYAPYNLEFQTITGRVVANANDDIEIEIKKNGNLMTGLTIPVGEYSAVASGNDSTVLTMNEGDYLTVDILQVGTVVQPGSDLYLQFKYINI
jgi:hypothetical protein